MGNSARNLQFWSQGRAASVRIELPGVSGVPIERLSGRSGWIDLDYLRLGTDREISAVFEHLGSATKDLFFLVSILQVRARVVSFSVSLPNGTLHALIAGLVLIPRCAQVDG